MPCWVKIGRNCYTKVEPICGTTLISIESVSDGLLRKCVPLEEATKIIEICHSAEYGGHYRTFRTHAKIWQSGFFWPSMYEDTKDFIRRCTRCQKHGNINTCDAMPLTNNLQVELFDVWGINSMGPFPKSYDAEYILVDVDYVSK